MNYFLVLIAFCSISLASAGDRAGNGGDVIVCRNGESESVTLLDRYEADFRKIKLIDHKGLLNLINSETVKKFLTSDVFQLRNQVEFAIANFSRIDPYGAFYLRAVTSGILNDVINYESTKNTDQSMTSFINEKLVDINDSLEIAIPQGCHIEQLIIYLPKKLRNEKTFYISKRLWDKMSVSDKALAILHEGLYMYFSKSGWTNSKFARYINAIINSSHSNDYTFENYVSDSFTTQSTHQSFMVLFSWPTPGTSYQPHLYLKSVDSLFRNHCQTQYNSTFSENVFCLPVELMGFFEHMELERNNGLRVFTWRDYRLVPFKVVVRGQEVIGYEAIVTRNNLNPIRSFVYESKNQEPISLTWDKNLTLEKIFKEPEYLQFDDENYPKAFVDLLGNVKYLANNGKIYEL